MKLFAQIQKVDEERRLVYGRAADETPDKSGEILNYDASKPHFQKWSAEMSKDTDGKSLGNVRAMHGKVAVGKLTDIQFDDSARAIDVCAKVVDDNEWRKVLEGVYSGFSIGGSYGAKSVEKVDGKEFTRYEAIPNEISLVDRPCIPTAKFFQVQKADGSTQEVEFQKADAVPEGVTAEQWGKKTPEEKAAYLKDKKAVEDEGAEKVEKVAEGTVDGTPEQVDELTAIMAEKGLSLGDVIEMAKVAAREGVNPKSGEKEYGDVKFADAKNKKYPLDTEAHVRAAASYFGMDKNRSKYSAEDQKTIDSAIASAKKKFGIGEEAKDKEAEKVAQAQFEKAMRSELRKGMYGCAQFAQLITALQELRQSEAYEAFREGEESSITPRLDACMSLCAEVLKEWIDEEIAESGEGGVESNVMALAEQCGELAKHEGDPMVALVKYGARNSGADKSRIDSIHKAAVELGADCGAAKADATGDLAKSDVLSKLIADAVAPMQKLLDEAADKIKKLEAQPAAPKVVLRAVSKAEDNGQAKAYPTEADLVKDAHGAVHPAASLIKQAFDQGGAPLVYRG